MKDEELDDLLGIALSPDGDIGMIHDLWMQREEFEASAAAFKTVSASYASRASSKLAQAERIRAAVLKAMKKAGLESVKAGPLTLNVTRGGKKAVVIDGPVPDEYMRIKKEPDKVAIGKALDEGELLDFAHHDDTPEYIREY